MARALKEHWERTFAATPIDEEALEHWLHDTLPNKGRGEGNHDSLPPPDSHLWKIRRKDVAKAVRLSNNSAPGPDGIPYLAWRKLGNIGIDYLFQAVKCLTTEEGKQCMSDASPDLPHGQHTFNAGLLCCLPKKPTGQTGDGHQYFAPDATRPLTLVNCDNRLVASAARFRWESILAKWISPAQRGFLPNRSMLANVVEVEEQAMLTSLQEDDGALILFDFKAAFPSVSHDFILATLRHIGMPEHALRLVQCLYDNNYCDIALQGARFEGFPITAGIRQGCPLSPLLFVTVAESLLRGLQRCVHKAVPRAYADDTALIIQDLFRDLPHVQEVFGMFAKVSGLRLNIPKTVIVPLGGHTPEEVTRILQERDDVWKDVLCAHKATYLGFVIGPDKQEASWYKPVAKAMDRVRSWDWSNLGFQFASSVYNSYVLSTMAFVAQLEMPPPDALQAEKAMLFKAASGPGNWCEKPDLFLLQRAYGLPFSFRSLEYTARAAQMRVALWEDITNGGLRITKRYKHLQEWMYIKTRFLGRRHMWRRWYDNSFITQLQSNIAYFTSLGSSPYRLLWGITKAMPQPWTETVMYSARTTTQKTAYMLLIDKLAPTAVGRLHDKMLRWTLTIPLQTAMELVVTRMKRLAALVPPRVQSALFSTLWNRWTTARRFQNYGSACLLGCGCRGQEDAIEHYVACPVVRSVAAKRLHLHITPQDALENLLLIRVPPNTADTDSWLLRCAVMLYAVYRTTNDARKNGAFIPRVAQQALKEAIYEGTKGHKKTMRCVDNAYNN